jgi:hypothetical protein
MNESILQGCNPAINGRYDQLPYRLALLKLDRSRKQGARPYLGDQSNSYDTAANLWVMDERPLIRKSAFF